MQYQLVDGVIETGVGSYNKPPDNNSGQHVGVKIWLKINNEWRLWNKSAPHFFLAEAPCLTVKEFCEYYADYID